MTETVGHAPWKKGFEIELLAPRGRSRRDLAHRIAQRVGGRVETCFYPQSEPSLVPGLPVFENLVMGFDVLDARDEHVALLVDDLTLRDGLDRDAAPKPGWKRILSDDRRILALVQRHCDPDAPLDTVLKPLATLFGTELEDSDGGISKVSDAENRSVAMAAQMPGERERPCEIITPPLTANAESVLADLLADAQALGFTLPLEAATHVHFDAERLRSAPVLSRLIRVLYRHGAFLRDHVNTNPHCTRLAPVPTTLNELALSDRFRNASWTDAQRMLVATKPSKYCDFNFFNLAFDTPGKPTFEVRILPGLLDAKQIMLGSRCFERLLLWATETAPDTSLEDVDSLQQVIDPG